MREPVGGTAVVVARHRRVALMDLGVLARGAWSAGVVGITGSVGKTTTKDLLARVPRLELPDGGQRAVLQQRARPPAHAAQRARRCASGSCSRWAPGARATSPRLAQVARPDVGIVTSVAMAHVEYFGDLDGVARAKSELVTALPPSGRRRLELRRPAGAPPWRRPAPAPSSATQWTADAEVARRGASSSTPTCARGSASSTPWGSGRGAARPARGAAGARTRWRPRPRRCGAASPSTASSPPSAR